MRDVMAYYHAANSVGSLLLNTNLAHSDTTNLHGMADYYRKVASADDLVRLDSPTTSEDLKRSLRRVSKTLDEITNQRAQRSMATYESDEELYSPIDSTDTDGLSFSDSMSMVSVTSSNSPAPLDFIGSTESIASQCKYAQEVQFIPGGTAKIVSLPKLVKVVRGHKRSALTLSSSRGQLRSYRSQADLKNPAPLSRQQSSSEIATVATFSKPNRASYISTTKNEQPSLPLLEAAAQVTIPDNSLKRLRSPGSDKENASPTNSSSPTKSAPIWRTPSARRKPKSFSLSRFSKSSKRKTSTDTSSSANSGVGEGSELTDIYSVLGKSTPKQKMVPRGASERAPPVQLPPCPDDYEKADDPFVTSRSNVWSPSDLGTKTAVIGAPRTETMKRSRRERTVDEDDS